LEEILAENYMNKMLQLRNPEFMRELFTREVLPHYPAFKSISRIEIKPYKDLVWDTTYHVVVGFTTYFLKASGEEDKIPIICSAHSDEPRQNVYEALKYLWAVGLPNDFIDIPDPIFYSDYFRGTFYRGLKGEDLLYYIKKKDWATVKKVVVATGKLFARFHALPAPLAANFNPLNARIKTVIPGTTKIFREMAARYNGQYKNILVAIYDYLIKEEEKFFALGGPLALIHGDAHPENILRTAEDRIGLIDFTDVCLGDAARDLGSFCQQLEYKIVTKAGEKDYAPIMRKLFMDSYLAAAGLKLTPELEQRINLYYNWTAIRSAVFWFLKFGHNEERAKALLEQVQTNLKL